MKIEYVPGMEKIQTIWFIGLRSERMCALDHMFGVLSVCVVPIMRIRKSVALYRSAAWEHFRFNVSYDDDSKESGG